MAVAPAKTKLRADVAGELPGRSHYARFDFDFLRLAVQLRQQAVDGRNHLRNVVDDDGVGAIVSHHIAALREELLYRDDNVFRLGIAQEAGDRDLLDGQCFRFDLRPASIGFMLQGVDRGDAQDVAFQFARQFVVLEHDVECLIPRHVIEHNRQRAVHVRIEHNVQAADFVNEAEEIFQVNVFQVDRDRLARILRPNRGRLLAGLRLLLRSQVDRGCDAAGGLLRLGSVDADRKQFRGSLVGKARSRFLGANRGFVRGLIGLGVGLHISFFVGLGF